MKSKNIVVTLLLLIVAVGLAAYIFITQFDLFSFMWRETKYQAENILGIEYKPKEKETVSQEKKENPDYEDFKRFNDNINETLSNRFDENYSMTKELSDSLKTLYNEAKGKAEGDSVDYPIKGGKSIKMKVLDSYLAMDESEIGIPDGLWHGLGKSKLYHTDEGALIDGYAYCVVEVQVTNTSGEDISLILTNPAMELHFMDENCERYAYAYCCLFTYQPGDIEQQAAYLYDFGAGESFTSKYVFTVPTAAFKYFDCCLAVSPAGSGTFLPQYSTMVILESLSEKE